MLITGAARGIGAETARRLVAKGARVSLVGLEPDRLAALAGELGDRAVWFEADVTDQDAVDGAVAGTVAAFGGIDVVLANAGIANNGTVAINPRRRAGPHDRRQPDRRRAHGLRRAPARHRSGAATCCIISSTAAFTMMPGMAAYAASKAGVEQFANCLRLEVAHKGVKVGSVHPGWIDTDLVRDQRNDLKTFDDGAGEVPVADERDDLGRGLRRRDRRRDRERRRSRVYVPRAIAIVQALRTVITGPLAVLAIRREAQDVVPQLEAEVVKLGRHFGGSSVAMPPPAAAEEREKLAS